MDMQLRLMIAHRPGIGATGHITQASRLNFTSLVTTLPIIIIVRRGRKVIRAPGQIYQLEAGEAIAVAQGQVFDFENIPAEDGDYEARWLTLEPEIVAAFGEPEGTLPMSQARLLGRLHVGLSDAFENAVLALQDTGDLPEPIVRHRVTELLAWLATGGCRFSLMQSDSFAARIRRLVGSRPDTDWQSAKIATALGVSEATLRRRLRDEGVGLREILTDIRMTHAMQLLQSSNLPVSQIAARSGFESQSRFAIRFRHRFGFAPTAVRGQFRSRSGRISSGTPGARPAG